MAIKRLNENPTVSDQIIIDITTPDADGCLLADPYKVDSVTIYYIERNYGENYTSYDKKLYDENIQLQLNDAVKNACNDPTDDNLNEVTRLKDELEKTLKIETFYYSNAKTVKIYGTSDNPAWLSSSPDDASIIHIELDENDDAQYGHFEVEWKPVGLREGDYFICWTWSPNPSGEKLSSHFHFNLNADTQVTTSIPTHFTNKEKYEILMERYLPSMFKLKLNSKDITPEVLQEFNKAVAKGFTFIEDMANQVIDLIDANSTHESLLPFLGNLFNIRLKTDDPTLWRRQIKNAVPLFKKKGTYEGLYEALNQAGITLKKLSRLWQVISKYTYQEYFLITDSDSFVLSESMILPLDEDNFELYYRSQNEEWEQLTSDYVTFSQSGNETVMVWMGDQLSYGAIELTEGDSIRVVYQIAEVPNNDEQSIENYIRSLPLSDQRDEQDQLYPLKNWNVRVIEEDDPLIDLVISTRHPYFDPVIFGKVRTEMPFGEKAYNADEYNGSIRDSESPCDIDRDFMDACSSCLSSKFVIDLEISNLSNDRILEAQDVLKEYMPFHAVLHSINLIGKQEDLIKTPIEQFNKLITFKKQEFTLPGNGQRIFNRSMESSAQFKRDELANVTTAVSSGSGTGYNIDIVLFAPNVLLDDLGVDLDDNYNWLEVLSPSSNAGDYAVENAIGHHAEVAGVTEPLDESAFTFRLSNERASKSSVSIYQDDVFKFSDSNKEFWKNSIKTQWDVEHDESYFGTPWKVQISAYSDEYEIKNINSDGSLILDDPNDTLPTSTTTGITYVLVDGDGETIDNGTTGRVNVRRRGRVDVSSGTISIRGNSVNVDDIRNLFDAVHENNSNNYVLYSGNQYPLEGFVEGETHEFYISDYTAGDVAGATIKIYKRLVNGQKGYFHYKGIKLITSTNYETGLDVQNGENADALYPDTDANGDPYTLQLENNSFKENYLILIGSKYYAITSIDGTEIILAGPDEAWKLSGTALTFDILKYEKVEASVPERIYPSAMAYDFDQIDRAGQEIIISETETDPGVSMLAMATAFNSGDEIIDTVGVQEGISFQITTRGD